MAVNPAKLMTEVETAADPDAPAAVTVAVEMMMAAVAAPIAAVPATSAAATGVATSMISAPETIRAVMADALD